jgi:hypothetical protein
VSIVVKAAVGKPVQRSSDAAVVDTVAAVIADVRAHGDDAVMKYSQQFDRCSPAWFRLGPDQVGAIVSSVPESTLDDLRFAQHQVRRFAGAQRQSLTNVEIETLPGVVLGLSRLRDKKGYTTNLTSQSAEFVIDAYHQLWRIEKAFRMSKHDLRPDRSTTTSANPSRRT